MLPILNDNSQFYGMITNLMMMLIVAKKKKIKMEGAMGKKNNDHRNPTVMRATTKYISNSAHVNIYFRPFLIFFF
ncbi:hypothetical protein BCR42DRAFT_226114 [Absidia repens]|uniref:Uncharacterized protein n=1 Tax=Absidia repens TaxID=90262 RepID=A0A1X2IPE4_9FUNG|nr:hypothetical protein BCR42DRAFT_226114 [Absidia repens]